MDISWFAIIFLSLYVALGQIDALSLKFGLFSPVFAGAVTGFLLGDLKTGLLIGGTLQLTTLGVATYGGATVPDFLSGSVMGTAYAIMASKGVGYGIGLAIPIGLLLTQMDILARMSNTFFHRMAMRHVATGNYKGVERANLLGMVPWSLSRFIPVFIGLVFGSAVVKAINAWIPVWFMNGLKAAGMILPAMGIAILMRYLPLKRYYPYFIFGFAIMAYFSKSITLLGVSLFAFALAAVHVLNANKNQNNENINSAADSASGRVDDEEVEIDD